MDTLLFSALDWLGIGLGFLLIGIVLAIAAILDRSGVCDAFVTRKIVHIGVGHWWFVAWYFHSSVAPALVGPIVFTVVNFLFYRMGRVHALGHGNTGDHFGIVLYPVSLIVLVVASWSGPLSHEAAAAGVLIMAWGDGLAAIVGRAASRGMRNRADDRTASGGAGFKRIRMLSAGIGVGDKTVAGSSAMFVAGFLAVLVLAEATASPEYPQLVAGAAAIAGISTFAEAFTPWGLDNISVPLSSAAAFMLLIG